MAETYESYKQAYTQTGIPIKHFRRAKAMGAPGFKNTRIYFDDFKPWYEAHKEELESNEKNELSLEDIKKDNALKDGVLKDLEIKKRKREFLDPEEVKTLLQSVAIAQSSVLKKVPSEMACKLAGKTAPEVEIILNKMVADLVGIFKSSLDNWN